MNVLEVASAVIVVSMLGLRVWPRELWPIQVIVIAAGVFLVATIYCWQKRGRGK